MTIFTRDFIRRIVVCVFLPIFLFQFLPSVTCQKESDSSQIPTFPLETIIGVIMLSLFLLSMVSGCLFYGINNEEIEATSDEVLNSRVRNGLDKEVIESFPVFLYSEVKGLKIGKGGVECAICLNEFEDDETVRWMPPCSHTFHANCVDEWLSSRTTCPACRSDLSLKPGESLPHLITDIETANAPSGILGSPENISLTNNSATWSNNGNDTTPRSRSTGLMSNPRVAEILIPRSRSTGHQLVQLGENLDRFTIELPEEVQRRFISLNQIRSHMPLPQARSSRQGYRSGSTGGERSIFSQGRQSLRSISKSLSLSFQTTLVRSKLDSDDLVQETSEASDHDFRERSFQRLLPENA